MELHASVQAMNEAQSTKFIPGVYFWTGIIIRNPLKHKCILLIYMEMYICYGVLHLLYCTHFFSEIFTKSTVFDR